MGAIAVAGLFLAIFGAVAREAQLALAGAAIFVSAFGITCWLGLDDIRYVLPVYGLH